MSKDKQAKVAAQLVQAFRLRRLATQILREAEALESKAEPLLAAWDDPAVTREDVCKSKGLVTHEAPITPKEHEELLDLIQEDKSAISESEEGSPINQNRGNWPGEKSKDKWSSSQRSLKEKLATSK